MVIRSCLVLSLVILVKSSWGFLSAPRVITERYPFPATISQRRNHLPRHGRWGPRTVLASANPDVRDTSSVISEMENWARLINPEPYARRKFQYHVSSGTSLPEVLSDFWNAVSKVIDQHRATQEDRPLKRLLMFVAPFCEELRDYETMEHAQLLLEHSAKDGGCVDFGRAITHMHYHPNFRYRPRPKETRMAYRHAPYPAFSIEVLYKKGGLKSLASIRAAAKVEPLAGRRLSPSPPRPRPDVSSDNRGDRAAKRNEEWAALARSSLESVYNAPACYGTEGSQDEPYLRTRVVPESSQEILQATKEWLKGVLKEAAESKSAVTNGRIFTLGWGRRGGSKGVGARRSCSLHKLPTPSGRLVAAMRGSLSTPRRSVDLRSTAFKPPSAAEAAATIAAAEAEKRDSEAGGVNGSLAVGGELTLAPGGTVMIPAIGGAGAGVPGGDGASARGDGAREDAAGRSATLRGRELVRRMGNVAQYVVTRSRTAEEVFSDVWELIAGMPSRAAVHGCGVPTEDYSSSCLPCYGAVVVTPDLSTYNAEAFHRFQEILNRGIKHLPMEHDISVEAFHPEDVSEASPLDHVFLRSPYPTLHVCYHGVREAGSWLHPAVKRLAPSSEGTAPAVTSNMSNSNNNSNNGGGSGNGNDNGTVSKVVGSQGDESRGASAVDKGQQTLLSCRPSCDTGSERDGGEAEVDGRGSEEALGAAVSNAGMDPAIAPGLNEKSGRPGDGGVGAASSPSSVGQLGSGESIGGGDGDGDDPSESASASSSASASARGRG